MTRMELPKRRKCESFPIPNGHATVSFYPDGRPGEVFIDMGKPGSDASAAARDAAVAASIALQHGAALDTLKGAMTRLADGRAAGPLGHALDAFMGSARHDA